MGKPCTDCPHNKKHHIKPTDGGHGAGSSSCMKGSIKGPPHIPVEWGYYEKIANCVDYAEYLAWQRERRKKK